MAKKSQADDFLKALGDAKDIDLDKAAAAAPRGAGARKEDVAKAFKGELKKDGDTTTCQMRLIGIRFGANQPQPGKKGTGGPYITLVTQFVTGPEALRNLQWTTFFNITDQKIKNGARAGETITRQQRLEEVLGTLKKCGVDVTGIAEGEKDFAKKMKAYMDELPKRIAKLTPLVEVQWKKNGEYLNESILAPVAAPLKQAISDDFEEEDDEEEDDDDDSSDDSDDDSDEDDDDEDESDDDDSDDEEEDDEEEDDDSEEDEEDDSDDDEEDDEEDEEEEDEDDEPPVPEKGQRIKFKVGRKEHGGKITRLFTSTKQANVMLDNGEAKTKVAWAKLLDEKTNKPLG